MENVYVHPTALVETEEVGAGTRVWAYCHILPHVHIGANCNIGDHCFVETGASVGDNVTIKNGTMVWEGVTLEDGVFVGPNVFFTNDLYPRSPRLPQAQARYGDHRWLSPIRVEYGAALGAGAVILAGVTIGAFAVVGAGGVVTHNVPPYALVSGNPARWRGWVCECGQPLRFQENAARCLVCDSWFRLQDGAVVRQTQELVPA
jgi:acetyltransferase-like isoleucine patch superfamily enzyme